MPALPRGCSQGSRRRPGSVPLRCGLGAGRAGDGVKNKGKKWSGTRLRKPSLFVFKAAEQRQVVSAHAVSTQGFEKLGSKLAPDGAPGIRGLRWSHDRLQICALGTPCREKKKKKLCDITRNLYLAGWMDGRW